MPDLHKPPAALAISVAALFVALGATSYAAFTLPAGSVGTRQLRKGAVTTSKIANGAVTAGKINTGGLTVPNALHAGSATTATSASHATSADGLTPLPSGQSESGAFSAGGANATAAGYIGFGITYPRPLASPISNANIIDVTTGSATHCPGLGLADPGYLCLYDTVRNGVGPGYGYSSSPGDIQQSPSVGVVLYWPSSGADSYVGGEWTVTAP
jgi:hypothetical protein